MKRCSYCWWFSKALLSSLYILPLPLAGVAEHLLCCFQPSSSFQTNYAARMRYARPDLYKHCWWAHFAFSKGSRLAGVRKQEWWMFSRSNMFTRSGEFLISNSLINLLKQGRYSVLARRPLLPSDVRMPA